MLFIFDFDGTLTDSDVEQPTFLEFCAAELAVETRLWVHDISTIMDSTLSEMIEHPENYPWIFAGQAVSSAIGDPYLRFIWQASGVLDVANCYKDQDRRDRFLHLLLTSHAPRIRTFRDGAKKLLSRCSKCCVVSNCSQSVIVENLVNLFWSSPSPKVVGSANKHHIDPKFTLVPESLQINGFPRPVLLRRAEYYRILDEIRTAQDYEWSRTTVVGNDFEQDLALPAHLGANIILVKNALTPRWEIEHVAQFDRGRVIQSLGQV